MPVHGRRLVFVQEEIGIRFSFCKLLLEFAQRAAHESKILHATRGAYQCPPSINRGRNLPLNQTSIGVITHFQETAMTFIPQFDHKRASITIYSIIALNTTRKSKNTINRKDAAQVLADLLKIDPSTPMAWLRGNFETHPFSRENFLKFSRIYQTKIGLESPKEVRALAINIYGIDYKKAIELLDPSNRGSDPPQDIPASLPGKVNLATAICNLIEASSPEDLKKTLLKMLSSISAIPIIPIV
jgi:hypothetical protein